MNSIETKSETKPLNKYGILQNIKEFFENMKIYILDIIDFMNQKEFDFFQNSLTCLPTLTFTVSLLFINFFSIYYYQMLGLKLNIMLIVISVSRCIEIIIDPFISNYYDILLEKSKHDENEKTSIVQYCLFNSIICGMCILLHFIPDMTMSANNLAIWYGFTYAAFTISYSFVTIPIYVIIWFEYPYEGVKNLMSPQLLVSLITGFFENLGLLIGFILGFGMSSFTDYNDSQIDINKFYGSCYNSNGYGTSCLINPAINKKQTYPLFDSYSSWNTNPCSTFSLAGVYYTDPSQLYTPSNCANLKNMDDTMKECIEIYCICIGECTNLHNLSNIQYGMLTLGIMIFCAFLPSVIYLLYLKFGIIRMFKCSFDKKWSILNYFNDLKKKLTYLKRCIILYWNGRRRLRSNCNITNTTSSISTQNNALRPSAVEEPIVCKCMNLLKNPIVRSFLIPQLLDDIVYFMVLSTMFFYIQCVVAPEFQNYDSNCNYGIGIVSYGSSIWSCQTMIVTGVVLSVLMATSIVSLVFWYRLIPYIGTVRTWQVSSLLNVFSIITFVFSANKTNYLAITAIGLSVLIGFTTSGRFLANCIVVDIVYYYEFISEKHYPHMFAMFKNLSIKITTIITLIIFIPMLYQTGYKLPIQTVMVKQTVDVEYLCYMFTIVIPCLLSIISFIFKLQIRFSEIEQYNMLVLGLQIHDAKIRRRSSIDTIREGSDSTDLGNTFCQVNLSNKNKSYRSSNNNIQNTQNEVNNTDNIIESAADPVSAILYPATFNTIQDLQTLCIFDYFWTSQNILDYYTCSIVGSTKIGIDLLVIRMRDFAAVCFFLLCGVFVALGVTAHFIQEESGISTLPLLFITFLGYAIVLFYCSIKRLQAIISLKSQKNQPNIDNLERVIRNAEIREEMYLNILPTRAIVLQYIQNSYQGFPPNVSIRIRTKANIDKDTKTINKKELSKEEQTKKELLEWELNLKTAVKRALDKAKITTIMITKHRESLKKIIKNKSKQNCKHLYTLWEKEFYSYAAMKETKHIPNECFPIPNISANSLDNNLVTIREDKYSTTSSGTDESYSSLDTLEGAKTTRNDDFNKNHSSSINYSTKIINEQINMNKYNNVTKTDDDNDDSIDNYSLSIIDEDDNNDNYSDEYNDFISDIDEADSNVNDNNITNNNEVNVDTGGTGSDIYDGIISDDDEEGDDDRVLNNNSNNDQRKNNQIYLNDENSDNSFDNYTLSSNPLESSNKSNDSDNSHDKSNHSNNNKQNLNQNNQSFIEESDDDEICYDTPSEIDFDTPSD